MKYLKFIDLIVRPGTQMDVRARLSITRKYLEFIVVFIEGIYYKFPLCCVIQFSLETFDYYINKFNRFSYTMGYADNEWFYYENAPWNRFIWNNDKLHGGYIPCDKCIKKFHEQSTSSAGGFNNGL